MARSQLELMPYPVCCTQLLDHLVGWNFKFKLCAQASSNNCYTSYIAFCCLGSHDEKRLWTYHTSVWLQRVDIWNWIRALESLCPPSIEEPLRCRKILSGGAQWRMSAFPLVWTHGSRYQFQENETTHGKEIEHQSRHTQFTTIQVKIIIQICWLQSWIVCWHFCWWYRRRWIRRRCRCRTICWRRDVAIDNFREACLSFRAQKLFVRVQLANFVFITVVTGVIIIFTTKVNGVWVEHMFFGRSGRWRYRRRVNRRGGRGVCGCRRR